MKQLIRCVLVLIPLLSAFLGNAQVQVTHKSDWFYIEPGTDVHIKGNLSSLKGNDDPLLNLGGMYISDSVTCFGNNKIFGETPNITTANVYLNGDSTQLFTGDSAIRFGNLHIRNSYDSLEAHTNVEIYNFIQLDSGNVFLRNVTLDLLNTGRVVGEDNSKRIYTSEYGQIHFGRPMLNGQTYTNIAGIGFGLSINGNLGINVDVYRKNVSQLTVANGSIDRIYYFKPQQNGFVSAPNIHYLDPVELHGNDETTLEFFRSQSLGTTWQSTASALNNTTDLVTDNSNVSFPLTTETMVTLASSCASPPYLHFVEDTMSVCNGESATLLPDGITGMASVWSTGIQNKNSIQVSVAGTYKVTIFDLSGCSTTDSIVVVTAQNPVVSFTAAPACIGDVTSFVNTTTVNTGNLSYSWELGDFFTPALDTSSLKNPSIQYSNQGSYTATLTATSTNGCTATASNTVVSLAAPVVSFNLINACQDSTLVFENFTVINPSSPITYDWNFGNGNNQAGKIPNYSYPLDGTYTVELTATSNGCSRSATKNITIYPNPTAAFNTAGACAKELLLFNNTSSITSGSVTYFWELEQGITSNLTNPTNSFNTSGTYDVSLTSRSNKGCVANTINAVKIDLLPVPSFTAEELCLGDSVQYVNTSNPTSTFSWDFGNGNNSTLVNPKEAFTTAGLQTVELEEMSTNGCKATVTQTINAKAIPTVAFNVLGECEKENVTFTNTSTASVNAIYSWNFGNGNNSTLNSPNEIYATAGTYQVQLMVNDKGCSDSMTTPITVNQKPIIDLGEKISTCGASYTFDALNVGSSYLWSNLTTTTQTLVANTNGTYWVQISNANGCVQKDTVSLILNAQVVPNLGNDATFCDATTLDGGYPLASYNWNTGASSQTIDINTSGTYSITITDQNGCVGIGSLTANVVTSVLPTLGANLVQCEGNVITLNPIQVGTYKWSTGETASTIDVEKSDIFWVDLTDQNGCVSRDSVTVFYNPVPLLNLGLDGSYCNDINLDITQPNVAYLWNDGSKIATKTIATEGLYWAELEDLTTKCTNRDSLDVVTFISSISVDLGTDTVVCSGESLPLDALNIGGQYIWNIGDTTQTLLASATGIYSVQITTPDGCSGADTIKVIVQPFLSTDLGEDVVFCAGTAIDLISPQDSGVTYSWFLDGKELTENKQVLTVETHGLYVSQITDKNGCTASDTVSLVETTNTLTADFLVSTSSVFVGDTLLFINLSAPSPYFADWSFDDGYTSSNEDPIHTFFFEGEYDVTLIVSDSICVKEIIKTITISPSPPDTSIEVNSENNDITNLLLYPNPNNGIFDLDVELKYDGTIIIYLIDVLGTTYSVQEQTGKHLTFKYQKPDLPNGMFFLRVELGEQIKFVKFVKN